MIPYGKHYVDDADILAVVKVLKSSNLTQGPKVYDFELAIQKYTGSKYVVAVSSGTAALHLSCLALDIGKNDNVATTVNTFVATVNSILYVGGNPKIIDIDPDTLNIDINKFEKECSLNNIKAAIPVHFSGYPCNMKKIKSIADDNNVMLIEDASHALGAKYEDGSMVGNCSFSDVTVFSFHPVKGVSCGEGGVITTNSKAIYKKLLRLRSHGISKGNFDFPGSSLADDELLDTENALENGVLKPWYYEMQELGYNYRITDIQAALGESQLKKIDKFIKKRNEIVAFYDKKFELYGDFVNVTQLSGRNQSSHHLYVILIDFEYLGITRHSFMKKLINAGIGTQVHYIPIVEHPYYKSLGYKALDYPRCYEFYEKALSIPIYYGLTHSQQLNVINSMDKIFQEQLAGLTK